MLTLLRQHQVPLLKALDRAVGREALQLLSLGRGGKPRYGPVDPRHLERVGKITIIRPGGIGDAALLYPLLAALRKGFPQAALHVVAEGRNAQVFEVNDLVDRVWQYDREFLPMVRDLRQNPPDVLIDTEQSHRLSAAVALWSKSPVRLGFDTNERRKGYTHLVPYNFATYEVECFLDCFRTLTGDEVPFNCDEPFIPVARQHLDWAARQVPTSESRPLICLSPGASIPRKRWPWQYFYQLAEWAVNLDFRVALIGGADCVGEARLIAGADPSIINLVGKTTLPQTAAVLKLSRVFVSADTGVLHVAYGVGTPTVHLFGPGVLSKWAPPGRNYLALTKSLPCSPCMTFGYARPCTIDHKCMKLISVEETKDAVSEVLDLSQETWLPPQVILSK